VSSRSKRTAASIALVCFLGLAAEVAVAPAIVFDAAVRAAVETLGSPALTASMRAVTQLGSQRVVIAISALLFVGLLYTGRRREAWLTLITISGAEFWLWALKALFHRARPAPFFDTPLPPSYSFPSGHALLSACLYGLIAELAFSRLRGWQRWVAVSVMAALILAIGWSRVYLGVHYPTDVIGGYLVAVLWLTIAGELVGT
jgi:undecaprenyl-diphosphatase